jgi:hypothetical protein
MSTSEEKAMMGLTFGGVTIGEQIDAMLKARELTRVIRDVVNDQRCNPISQGQTMLPETGNERPPAKAAVVERPIEQSHHVALCDRLMDAQDARDKQRR